MAGRDELGDRMKGYETAETSRRLDAHLPIYARIDGRSFSTYTRGMVKPFDGDMVEAMMETTAHLVGATHARIGYCQSDEISLVYLAEREKADVFFSGKVQKMASVLASMAAAKFATVAPRAFAHRLPHFDCRIFQLPSKTEAANCILWRALDARKNAISALAQKMFSPRQLHGKRQRDMIEMLREIDVDFDAMPAAFRNGCFLKRVGAQRILDAEELSRIPEAHRPSGPVMRSSIECFSTSFFAEIEDREAFIFGTVSAQDDGNEK